jgi:hypothetical protein
MFYSDMDSPPFQNSQGIKQPWRNNAAGKTTGLEVFFKSAEDEYLPGDQRTPGYNVRGLLFRIFIFHVS